MNKYFGMVSFPSRSSLSRIFEDSFDFCNGFDFVTRPLNSREVLKSDIRETDTSYAVEAELPGFSKSDIDVSIDSGILTIKAEINKDSEDSKENYVRKERYSGKYTRTYSFENIRESDISAKYENGILIVEIPKAEKVETKKNINID